MNLENEVVRIAGIVRESIVDGPGIRFVIFGQGCPHRCPGCHNQETLAFDGGYLCSFAKLLTEIDKNPLLSGVTFSGGEPFHQPKAFALLGKEIKKRGLHLITYTGYVLEQLWEMKAEDSFIADLLQVTDQLIDGPFRAKEKDLTLSFRGSKNQRIVEMAEIWQSAQDARKDVFVQI